MGACGARGRLAGLLVILVACKGGGGGGADGGGGDGGGGEVDGAGSRCGDGVVDPAIGERCDDGNTIAADGCSADCRSDETCGNGIVDTDLPKDRSRSPDGWPRFPECFVAEPDGQGSGCAEVCDDGNQRSGDGCSANCLSEESCPNGILDVGEACDDGNFDSCDACPADCLSDFPSTSCGDGAVSVCGNEQCDPGPQEAAQCDLGLDVSQRCTFAVCGDGYRNVVAGEDCDDGNGVDTDDCLHCKLARCGDGAVDHQPPVVEACDLGQQNGAPGAPCSATCTVVP